MGDLLPFVVSGIALGAVYGLAATGLVLTYKTSGIFNFGHGAVATAAAFVFYWLTKSVGLGTGLALIVSVLVVGPGLGLAMEAFARKLAPRPTALKIVGTVGLILLVQGLAALKFGTMTIPMQQFLPGADKSFQLAGVVITLDKVIITAVAVLAVGVLYLFFRSSRTGLAMRAVVDDPDLLAMQAVDPRKVRRIAWIIGATFASLSGVLITPLVGLDAILLTFMVVQAFAGAAIGGFANIPLTLAGGIVVGVLSAVANQFALGHTWLTGLPASVPFLILFVVLLVRGRRLVSPTRSTGRLPEPYRAPGPVRIGTALVLFVPLLLLPTFAGDNLTFFTTGLATGILLLSLGLLVRMSGQVSLCHAAFAAVGAVAFSQFALHFQLPWLVAVLLGESRGSSGRSCRRDPRHPAVGTVSRPGDLWLRHPGSTALLSSEMDVHDVLARPRDAASELRGGPGKLLLRRARCPGADGDLGRRDSAQQAGTPAPGSRGLAQKCGSPGADDSGRTGHGVLSVRVLRRTGGNPARRGA